MKNHENGILPGDAAKRTPGKHHLAA